MIKVGRSMGARLYLSSLAGIVLALSGCNSGEEAVALPSSTESVAIPPTPTSEKEAVKRAYTSFIAILDHADSIPEASRKQRLSAVMGEPQLSRVLNRIKQMKADHQGSYGKAIVHIQSVDVSGHEAVLRDCKDSSNTGLLNTVTKKKINRGVKEERIKTYLAKVDEPALSRWKQLRWSVARRTLPWAS